MTFYQNKNLSAIFVASILTTIVVWSLGIVRGRQWLLSDLNTPSNNQTSSVSLLFNSAELSSGIAVMESLTTNTPISKSFGGHIESKAYTTPIFGLRYIKISASIDQIEQIASITRSHLSVHYPDLKPTFSLSILNK